MYPRNAASPERVSIGAVVQISDGAVQTSGVSIKVKPQGTTASAGGGTTSYEEGIVEYLPTQAETNYTSFEVIAYKTGCIPVSVTVVTTASATPGTVLLAPVTHTSAVVPTVTTLTGHTAQTGDAFARLGAPAGASHAADMAAVKAQTAAIETDTQDIQSRIPAALVSGRIDASVGAMASGVLTATAIAADAITAAKIANGAIDAATFAAGAINAAAIASDAITDAKVASDVTIASVTGAVGSVTGAVGSVTGAVGSVTGNVGGNVVGTVASVVGAVGSVTGNVGGNVTGSVGSVASGGITRASLAADTGLQSVRSGTAQAGASTSITLDASASATTDFYVNHLVLITGGTGVGQARFITAYNGTTKVASVAAWATNPDNTSTFALLPGDAIPGASAPSAATIADAVWDEILSGHAVSGSTGEALAAAGGAGDPWITALPGSYSAGQAGYIIGTNLNATVSSRATQASVDTIDGIVDSILVDTAEIGAAGAGLTALPWNAAWDAEVQSECTDALNAYDPPTYAELVTLLAAADDSVLAAIAALVIPTATENADALLARDIGSGSGAGTLNERTVRAALRFIRNKWSISGSTLTVTKENDSDTAWTATVSTSAGADPVVGNDPT